MKVHLHAIVGMHSVTEHFVVAIINPAIHYRKGGRELCECELANLEMND